MKYFFFISLIVLFGACNDAGKNKNTDGADSLKTNNSIKKIVNKDSSHVFINQFADTVLESKIIDTLMKLSFVKKSNHYLDSLTGHKHGISFIMDSVGSNEIYIMAGYNGPERFETYYNFTVYPKTFEIMIEYTDTGELIPIAQYIKMKKE